MNEFLRSPIREVTRHSEKERGEAHRKEILLAAARELSDRSLQDQMFLGGNFLTAEGKERSRKIVRLDVPEYADEEPWLKDYCLKIVPNTSINKKEMRLHEEISKRSMEVIGLSVPQVYGEAPLSTDQLGLVLERLKRNTENNTWDRLISDAKKNRTAVRLSEEVAEKIESAFHGLHELGYIHGDINEGNIYLGNIRWRKETLPKEIGKVRPPTLWIAMDAEVKLLDFEKTEKIGTPKTPEISKLYKDEDLIVKRFLEHQTIEGIDDDSTTEEITEENDSFFDKIRAN